MPRSLSIRALLAFCSSMLRLPCAQDRPDTKRIIKTSPTRSVFFIGLLQLRFVPEQVSVPLLPKTRVITVALVWRSLPISEVQTVLKKKKKCPKRTHRISLANLKSPYDGCLKAHI